MRISKFGWLAALVALAAVVGALAFAPSADAAILTSSTKTCAATVTPNVFTCTYVVNWTGGSTFNGDTTAVTMTGPATYTAAITGVSNNPANCSIAIQAQTTTSFQFRAVDVVAGGCALAATTSATMTETVTVTGAGAVTQTALNGFSGTSTTATATGLVFTPATVNSVTKVCTIPANPFGPAGTVVPGAATPCTLTITFATAPVVPTSGTITTTNGTTAPAAFTCPAGAATCTVTETVTATAVGAAPGETITIGAQTFGPLTGGITAVVSGAPAVTVLTLLQCNGSSFDLISATITIPCRLDLSDNGFVPDRVSSGIVRITVGTSNGFAVATALVRCTNTSGTSCSVGADGVTMTVRCGAENTQDTCDFVDFSIDVSPGSLNPNTDTVVSFTVDAAYIPDNPALNTPQNLNVSPAFRVRRVARIVGCRQVVGLRLVGTGDAAALAQVRPGQIGNNQVQPGGQIGNPLAVGILPNGVTVNVIPQVRNSAGTIVDVGTADVAPNAGVILGICPAKFEISSLSGTLLSLSGTLTTNLRILCGNANLVNITNISVLDPNTCTTGVTFAVLGLGVGNVEINVRYEPLDTSLPCTTFNGTTVTCGEFEAVSFVTFVAPQVRIILDLNPNPVAVGATTTATATLQTLTAANCSAINPTGIGTCIDPTTGRPILAFTDPGSQLNGLVVFTTADASIARFADTGIANAGTGLNLGVVSTANQVTRECGAFSGGRNTVNPFSLLAASAAQPLASFFGGCTSATATLLGVNPGAVNIAAAFVPFLPGAAANLGAFTGVTATATIGSGLAAVNFFTPGIGPSVSVATLQVAGVPPTGNVNLVRGCNNITPTVSESVTAYMARVAPPSVVIATWQHNAATNTFAGAPGPASPASAAAVADLTSVTRLTPVFVCVTGPATLSQPAA